MSGLPPGQFTEYLIIGIITSTFAVLLEIFLKHRAIKPRTRFGALVALLITATLIAFFKEQAHPPEANRGTGGVSSSTATPTPIGTPTTTPSPIRQPTPTRENYVDSFVRENIAAPGKGQRRSGQWAIVISEPGRQDNYPKLATAIASLIAEAGHSTVAIFRPSAVHGTGFHTLFAADPALSRRLNEYCDQILIGKLATGVKDNPNFPGLLSVTLTVEVKIISTRSGDIEHQVETSAVGAGYDRGEAQQNAEEALAANLRSELRNVFQ